MPKLVLLYNPRSEFYAMPLGLLAIASALDSRFFTVRIVDGRLHADAHNRVLELADSALCIGMTVFTGPPIRDALDLAIKIKRRRAELPVIWGGWHPSILPQQCLQSGCVDIVVTGQGEASFAEIVQRLDSGASLNGCRGSFIIENGQSIDNGPRPFKDINAFPAANYNLLALETYFRKKGIRQIDYSSSRGCLYQCTFCADPQVYGGRWSGLEPRRVLDELLDLHARCSFDEVFFLDDDLFANPKRLVEICRLLGHENPGFGWKGTARADELCRMNEEALADLRRSGCQRINVGAESGSQTVLDLVKKRCRVAQLVDAGKKCRRHGIKLAYSFMAGFPGEPEEALDQTVALIRSLKEIDPDFETPIYFYAPYPGTALAGELERAGWHPHERLEDWCNFDIRKKRCPWTSARYAKKVQNLNFYIQKAYPGNGRRGILRQTAGIMARWRLEHGTLEWPIERHAYAAWSSLAGSAVKLKSRRR